MSPVFNVGKLAFLGYGEHLVSGNLGGFSFSQLEKGLLSLSFPSGTCGFGVQVSDLMEH